jgi:hypothetical protein
MLLVVFGHDAVARRLGVTCQTHILVIDLEDIAADADVRAIAVDGLVPVGQAVRAPLRITTAAAPASSTTTATPAAAAPAAVISAARTP